ncbi:MAG: 16S rRNA (adenine(1518)-N(6)/adenine(1519)-N(6))-dimethyltransferase RsmA [Spirochaetota bacterium]|nr:16S rRNA (adenine(1518)-N(6)/adenine(1519)-N(6))-dimethyltransferase RsmA [Spirochaetota bacterium]
MNTKDIINISKLHNLHPNKRLGQHFICNKDIIDRIITVSDIDNCDNVLEIGAGLGALTEELIIRVDSITIIEVDSGIVRFLRERFKERVGLTIIHADFLKLSLDEPFSKTISNLPYYCASEILLKIAQEYRIRDVYIMLQREMAERLVSQPGSKDYGAFTVAIGLYYKAKLLFHIDKSSFFPKPDVASSFVHLALKDDCDLTQDEIDIFHKVVRAAFWGRRKTIVNALAESPHLKISIHLIKDVLEELNIDHRIRGENLNIHDYIQLTQKLCQYIVA